MKIFETFYFFGLQAVYNKAAYYLYNSISAEKNE